MIDALLSECVIAFVGVPGRLDARSPEERVVDAAGDAAPELIPVVKAIVDAVYAAEPPLHVYGTTAAVAEAVGTFLRSGHPELSDVAVRAVADNYAFDWK